jgi:hypothetical protein
MSNDPAVTGTAAPQPTIHAAECAGGPSGAVLYAEEIDFDAAVARRRAGGDVVVRGNDVDANRRLAEAIESAVGPCVRSTPHVKAGPLALPHFQPYPRTRAGHTFYEATRKKARRKR